MNLGDVLSGLQQLLSSLCEDLKLPQAPPLDRERETTLTFTASLDIQLKELPSGVTFNARIAACPPQKQEELFLHCMRANFLAQATGGAKIGLDSSEKFLTLSLDLPYEINYRSFKDALELFLNYRDAWRKEIEKFES